MMNPVPWLQMTNMISYQGLVRTFLNTGLAILSPGAFEVHSDGIDVDNELFHYPIKKAYTPYNIHTYKTEEVVNQRNIKVKNMTLDEINKYLL